MKKRMLFLICFVMWFTVAKADNTTFDKNWLRKEFEIAAKESQSKSFYTILNKYQGEDALVLAYKAASIALQARNCMMPHKKISYANESMRIFSEAIKMAPQNIEVRYLRYCIQTNIPSFLGLSKNLSEDKKFILDNLCFTFESSLLTIISSYMENHGKLSSIELKKISCK